MKSFVIISQTCPIIILVLGCRGGKALKIVAELIPNLLTQNVLARSLDVSDSQAKG